MKTGAVSDSRSRLKWDIFLSFQRDTRHNFTEHLYAAFIKEQVRVWNDHVEHELGLNLMEAMEDSVAFVIVLSPDYAKSHWCLEELAMLCDMRSSLSRPILPIFYEVDPWHVRTQKGHFEIDFEEHSKIFSEEKIQRWRGAMNLVGDIFGFVYRYGSNIFISNLCIFICLVEILTYSSHLKL